LPLILLVIAGNEIVPAAALVYIKYLSSVAETVYVAVLTILNAALGLKFHVAFPLASDIKILFTPAPVGIVTVLLNVAAPVVVKAAKVVAPVTFRVEEKVAAPPCADVDDKVVAPDAANVVNDPVLAVVEPTGVF
jgi:hypothetical protein